MSIQFGGCVPRLYRELLVRRRTIASVVRTCIVLHHVRVYTVLVVSTSAHYIACAS